MQGIITVRQVYPFETVIQAIRFYTLKKPTRQRFINILEPDRFPTPQAEDFTGESPRDIWASIATAIAIILRAAHERAYWCFVFWHLAEREVRTKGGLDFSKEAIAKQLGIKKYQVSKYIREVEKDLARELVRRELLNPDALKPNFNYDRRIN